MEGGVEGGGWVRGGEGGGCVGWRGWREGGGVGGGFAAVVPNRTAPHAITPRQTVVNPYRTIEPQHLWFSMPAEHLGISTRGRGWRRIAGGGGGVEGRFNSVRYSQTRTVRYGTVTVRYGTAEKYC